MQLNVLLVGIAFLCLVGCRSAAELRDQFHPSDVHLSFDQRLRIEARAPIIVAGRVVQVNKLGQPEPSRGDHRIGCQLTRITVDVDEIIKGDIGSSQIEFYYFTYSPMASEADLGALRYLPAVGQNRIFFLSPFKDGYRSVGDLTDYTLRFSTGRHQRGFCTGKSPGCCIAEILLVPQRNADIDQFVLDLIAAAGAAEVLCSRDVAQSLLQRLTAHPDHRISEWAREVIAGSQSGTR
jgi:hypothetical protein